MTNQRAVNGDLNTDYAAVLNKSTVAYATDLLNVVSKLTKRGFDDQCYLQAYAYCLDYTKRLKPNISEDVAGTIALKTLIKRKVGSTLEDVFYWGIAKYFGGDYLKDVERQKSFKTNEGTIRPDFTWAPIKLIVECDGITYHSTPEQIENDKRKTKILNCFGYTVVRYSYNQLMFKPDEVFSNFKSIYTQLEGRRN